MLQAGVVIKPLVIDVEASGFGSGSCSIEVGVALAGGVTRCAIIRRQPEWVHWDSDAQSLHQISRETLLRYGKSVVEVRN
jgi:hypothetical protein